MGWIEEKKELIEWIRRNLARLCKNMFLTKDDAIKILTMIKMIDEIEKDNGLG